MSVGLLVGATHLPHVIHTTVALLLVLLILGISIRWGWVEALVASLAGGIGFDYFFLPPHGFELAAPEYWVSLIAFLLTAIVTGQLSARAATNRREAERRRDELEKLYRLGNAVMDLDDVENSLECIPSRIAATFEAGAAALFDAESDRVFHSGPTGDRLAEGLLRSVAATGNPLIDGPNGCCVVPIRRCGELAGSLGISGVFLTQPMAEAIAERVGVALAKAYSARETMAAELARRSENLKSAVLDALAHEIKGPLATVKVSVTTLLSQAPVTASQQHELLEIIRAESDRLEQWIDSATQISRIEAGQIRLEKKPESVKQVALRALDGLGPLADGRSIDVCIPDSLPMAEFDAEMMEKVLRLILDNALKYSPSGSPIAASAEFTGAEIVLSIEDRGFGVPESEKDRIFEPYYRGKNAEISTQGTGLGLASAKCIMQAHGGDIWVTGAPGAGSIFHISLPATKGVSDGQPESPERG
ncbi:MAG TPA: ATP-binding protein [Bryobacteraceae bacterium]|nr:ATP-binding protein [Bryobacteraceae bacterium]